MSRSASSPAASRRSRGRRSSSAAASLARSSMRSGGCSCTSPAATPTCTAATSSRPTTRVPTSGSCSSTTRATRRHAGTGRSRSSRGRSVRFRNVPSFVRAERIEAAGRVVDLAFGGAFYASLEERVEPGELPRLITLGRELKAALEAAHDVVHPLERELRDVYGVIFWQEEGEGPLTQRNVTVFADGEVDRSANTV